MRRAAALRPQIPRDTTRVHFREDFWYQDEEQLQVFTTDVRAGIGIPVMSDQDLIQLDIPFMVFAATSKEDIFRKPRIGMWNAYAKEIGVTSTDSTLL